METNRLDNIPTSIDYSSLTYKNFDKVLVGSIGAGGEGLLPDGEPANNLHLTPRPEPLSPKIFIVPKRKVVAAKREKDDLVDESAALEARKPHPSSRLQTQHGKKRSLTRKTAVISPFSVTPMSAWTGDITYPSNARVQVTEVDSPSSPRRRTRKTRVLSPVTTPNILLSPSSAPASTIEKSKEMSGRLFSPSHMKSALGLKDSSAPSPSSISIDSKIQSLLGLSGTASTTTPLISSSKSDADKKAAAEKELQEKRKRALELLQKQSRLLNPGIGRPAASTAISSTRTTPQGNTSSTTPLQKPIAKPAEQAEKPKPKPLPDPKKSEMAQKYMKEKKLQELRKKKADLEEDEKKREKIALALKKIEEERRLQREALLKKAKQSPIIPKKTLESSGEGKGQRPLHDSSKPAATTAFPAPAAAISIQANLTMTTAASVSIQEMTTQVVTLPILSQPTAITTEPRRPSHLASMLLLEQERNATPSSNPPSQAPADLALSVLKPKDSSALPPQVPSSDHPKIEAGPTFTPPPIGLPAHVAVVGSTSAEPPVPKEIMEKFDVLAQTVIAMSERILNVERDRQERERAQKKEAEVAAKAQAEATIKQTSLNGASPRRSGNGSANVFQEETVGVASLVEYSRKRKFSEKWNDAVLVLEAFFKKQKRQSMRSNQPLHITAPSNNRNMAEESQLMDMFVTSNKRPESPSRLKPAVEISSPTARVNEERDPERHSKTPLAPEEPILMDMFLKSNLKPQSPGKSKPLEFVDRLASPKKSISDEVKMMEMFQVSNKKAESPSRVKAVLFQFQDQGESIDLPVFTPKEPETSLGLLQSSMLAEMFEVANRKPQTSHPAAATSRESSIHYAPKANIDLLAVEEAPIFIASKPVSEKFSILDVFVKKLSVAGIPVEATKSLVHQEVKPIAFTANNLPEKVQSVAVPHHTNDHEVEVQTKSISPVAVDEVSAVSYSKTTSTSKEIQTDMDISDVSELSEIPVILTGGLKQAAMVAPAETATNVKQQGVKESIKLESRVEKDPAVNTEDYYNDSFDSLSSADASFKRPVSPAPFVKTSVKRARQLGGEALRRDLMGLDGQGRLAPESLGQRHDYELNRYDATTEYLMQVSELKENRESALWKQETVAIIQMYTDEKKSHDAELEAAKQQKLETMQKLETGVRANESNLYADYDSSFESFTEGHILPKIINHRNTQLSHNAADDDIIEEIFELESEKPIIPLKKSKREKSSIRQLLESAVEVIPMALKKANPPVLAEKKARASLTGKDADFSFKMKLANAEMDEVKPMTAAFAPSSFKKKGSSIAASSEESISEDLPFSDAPSRNSSISEHLPSDLSFHSKKNKPKPKKTDTDAYENESFYSADSDFESDSSSTTPTGDMEDLAIINQLLKTATKKLNSKTLTKKEKLINSTLKAVENLKENGDLDRKLNLESLRISKMLEDLIKGASVAAGALDSHSPVTADDVASDREIVATARKEIETKNTLKFIEAQLDNLKNDLNSYQEDLLDFGKGDSPKKKALQMASTSLPWPSFALPPAATPTVLLETPQNAVTDNSVSASDEMIIKLGAQILKMQSEIDARKSVMNMARKLEKDIIIQKQLNVVSGLGQELLYLNQAERLLGTGPLSAGQAAVENISPQVAAPSFPQDPVSSAPVLQKAIAAVDVDVFEEKAGEILAPKSLIPGVQDSSVKGTDTTEDTTSDLMSEKTSDVEVFSSEKIIPKHVESEKLYDYEDDFESDDEESISVQRLAVVASRPASAIPNRDSIDFLDLMTESIFSDLLENALDLASYLNKTQKRPKLIIPLPNLSAPVVTVEEPQVKKIVEPIWTFSDDLDKGVGILCEELERIFPQDAKYSEPPSLSSFYLDGLLPERVVPVLLDCLESSIYAQFERHRIYNRPNRPHYEKRMVKPAPISSAKLVAVCKKTLQDWIQYPKSNGTDIDLLLSETVKEEGKSYCDLKEDETQVKLDLVDHLFDDLISDTVNCLFQTALF